MNMVDVGAYVTKLSGLPLWDGPFAVASLSLFFLPSPPTPPPGFWVAWVWGLAWRVVPFPSLPNSAPDPWILGSWSLGACLARGPLPQPP